jgi:hypothetical protein
VTPVCVSVPTCAAPSSRIAVSILP